MIFILAQQLQPHPCLTALLAHLHRQQHRQLLVYPSQDTSKSNAVRLLPHMKYAFDCIPQGLANPSPVLPARTVLYPLAILHRPSFAPRQATEEVVGLIDNEAHNINMQSILIKSSITTSSSPIRPQGLLFALPQQDTGSSFHSCLLLHSNVDTCQIDLAFQRRNIKLLNFEYFRSEGN